MAFSLFKQIFGDLENASEEEKNIQGRNLVRIMFAIAFLGIALSLLIPILR